VSDHLEAEVTHLLATVPHYPLGERDAMKWAIAFRLIREARGDNSDFLDDGNMVGWFSNCMATGEMAATGGMFLSGDGLQAMIDGGSGFMGNGGGGF